MQVSTPKFSSGGPKSDSIVQTVSTLTSFVLVMLLYPEVQMKAQKELDAVIGPRIPLQTLATALTAWARLSRLRA